MDYQAEIDQSAICVLDEVSNVIARLEEAAVGVKGELVERVVRNCPGSALSPTRPAFQGCEDFDDIQYSIHFSICTVVPSRAILSIWEQMSRMVSSTALSQFTSVLVMVPMLRIGLTIFVCQTGSLVAKMLDVMTPLTFTSLEEYMSLCIT
jgi:hypothetical protein